MFIFGYGRRKNRLNISNNRKNRIDRKKSFSGAIDYKWINCNRLYYFLALNLKQKSIRVCILHTSGRWKVGYTVPFGR